MWRNTIEDTFALACSYVTAKMSINNKYYSFTLFEIFQHSAFVSTLRLQYFDVADSHLKE
jgi:hypothetical protein